MATEVTARRALMGLLLAASLLLAALLSPLATTLLLAAVLAATLIGLQDRLARRLRGRRGLAAGLMTAGVLFAILLPLAGLVTLIIHEAIGLAGFIARTLESGGTDALVARLPERLQGWARDGLEAVRNLATRSEGLLPAFGRRGGEAAVLLGGAVASTATGILKFVLFVIAVFFLLKDGPRLVVWLDQVSPLARGQTLALLAEFRRTASAVVRSSLLTALAQAVVAFVGLLIARAPQPVFLAFVVFVFALIPFGGAALATVVTGGILILNGRLWAGIFLCVWGVLAVGLVDNVVKPLVLKGGMEVHAAVIFFVLVGGLALLGPIGLVAGPLALSFFLAVVRLSRHLPASGFVPPLADVGATSAVPRRPPPDDAVHH